MIYDLKPFVELALESPLKRGAHWFESLVGKVYMRVENKAYNGRIYKVLTVANVEVFTESGRGKGTFTRWLHDVVEATVRETQGLDAVYIESVIDRRFAEFFIREGYTALPETPIFNFIKVLK